MDSAKPFTPVPFIDLKRLLKDESMRDARIPGQLANKSSVLPFYIDRQEGKNILMIGLTSPESSREPKEFVPFIPPSGTKKMCITQPGEKTRIVDVRDDKRKRVLRYSRFGVKAETHLATALREVEEEFGLAHDNIKTIFDCGYKNKPGKSKDMAKIYAMEVADPKALLPASDAEYVEWVSLPDIEKGMDKGIVGRRYFPIIFDIAQGLKEYYQEQGRTIEFSETSVADWTAKYARSRLARNPDEREV